MVTIAQLFDTVVVAADLSDLPDDTEHWCSWPYGEQMALVRRTGPDTYMAAIPYLFTWGLIVGKIEDCQSWFDDRWCYHRFLDAVMAGSVWDGLEGEPEGWHRHPRTGRRRDEDGSEVVIP